MFVCCILIFLMKLREAGRRGRRAVAMARHGEVGAMPSGGDGARHWHLPTALPEGIRAAVTPIGGNASRTGIGWRCPWPRDLLPLIPCYGRLPRFNSFSRRSVTLRWRGTHGSKNVIATDIPLLSIFGCLHILALAGVVLRCSGIKVDRGGASTPRRDL